jgi:hypothetical protein
MHGGGGRRKVVSLIVMGKHVAMPIRISRRLEKDLAAKPVASPSWPGLRPAMTEREKSLLRPPPYPDMHRPWLGHDDEVTD